MTTIEVVRSSSRLVADASSPPSLEFHERRHGALPGPVGDRTSWGLGLVEEIERAGLTGRGGGGFASFKKMRLALSARRAPVLVANGMEGEPASEKDSFLLMRAPHLVLDGVELVAAALGCTRTVLCIPKHAGSIAALVGQAQKERSASGYSPARVEVCRLPGRYVAGEESALVAGVAKRQAFPSFRPDKSVPLTIGRCPALVHNVETLAHVALIARYGADWFKQLGATEAPGTRLVTISGAVQRPGVVEIATGTPINHILEAARPLDCLQAVLVGGYGGSWIPRSGLSTPYAPVELGKIGASMGAGVLVALATTACGIAETARIARYMAAESAGQCGPCLFGLPAIADDLQSIADGEGDQERLERLLIRCDAVVGRGACRHPDGVVRLVTSALKVFSSDLQSHVRGASCTASSRERRIKGGEK